MFPIIISNLLSQKNDFSQMTGCSKGMVRVEFMEKNGEKTGEFLGSQEGNYTKISKQQQEETHRACTASIPESSIQFLI